MFNFLKIETGNFAFFRATTTIYHIRFFFAKRPTAGFSFLNPRKYILGFVRFIFEWCSEVRQDHQREQKDTGSESNARPYQYGGVERE